MPDEDVAIRVENVSKTFRLPHERTTSVKSAFINLFRKTTYEKQEALKNISFEVKKGEFFGIVGRNGSGKSTLLKLIAEIYTPTNGSININGTLTPFIELGVGFNPELTGRENVFLNGALLGLGRSEMGKLYKEIVEFAELEKFMDQKLKNYSSGMQVRLAFSIAIRANSKILILDEVLAVGDAAFQRKCYDYFMALKKSKRTVVLVTHDMGAVRQYCDRALMIEAGMIVKEGDPESVAQSYTKLFNDEALSDINSKKSRDKKTKSVDRWGEGKILADKPKVTVSDNHINIETSYRAQESVPSPIYGFSLYGPTGVNILENNTQRSKQKTKDVREGEKIEIEWNVPNIFASGEYSISVAVCNQSATRFYDWVNEAAHFTVNKDGSTTGLTDPAVKITKYNSMGRL